MRNPLLGAVGRDVSDAILESRATHASAKSRGDLAVLTGLQQGLPGGEDGQDHKTVVLNHGMSPAEHKTPVLRWSWSRRVRRPRLIKVRLED